MGRDKGESEGIPRESSQIVGIWDGLALKIIAATTATSTTTADTTSTSTTSDNTFTSTTSPSSLATSSTSHDLPAANGSTPGVSVSVFDELDSGVGGRIASRFALALRHLCRQGNQVICITHLPQVAVHADSHISVSKHVDEADGRMRTTAVRLTTLEERALEVAQMLGLGLPSALELFSAKRGSEELTSAERELKVEELDA
ncbi:hypothetical protein CLOP_g16789 [Closterium sp. NIES-67]|nr:hypothetical protein CLOP_g16789 [Closterium sp. NIES-67]